MFFNKITQFIRGRKKLIGPSGNVSSPVIVLALDGWGIAPSSQGNAIRMAKTPNLNSYPMSFPHGELIAAGESVGLPAGEAGNSEVGHLTMGAGKPTPQSLTRINRSIKDGSFHNNAAFLKTLNHVKTNGSKLHLMGMVGSGGVHSSIDHFYSLLEFCRRNQATNVCLHLFTDGRDTPPKEADRVIGEIENRLISMKVGKIATLAGRYYAMDRDKRWDRTKKAYDAIVLGRGDQANSAAEAIKNSYAAAVTDEFIVPTVMMSEGKPVATVDDNDAVIFFNFRIDRPRQLAMAFILPDFEKIEGIEVEVAPHEENIPKRRKEFIKGPTFKREKWPKNIYFVTMTEYHRDFPVSAIAFPPLVVGNPLPKLLSQKGMKQLCLAESEKEKMVTFYYNGMRTKGFDGEDVVIIPSSKVATYDKKPEMSLFEIIDEFKRQIARRYYHFVFVNFANADMVAHSGNLKASIEACEYIDKAVGEFVNFALQYNATVIITADHGNAEDLLTFPSKSFFFTTEKGAVNTEHSSNPVPVIIINNSLRGKAVTLKRGSLADIAPTVLGLFGMPVPPEMEGKDLLKQ